MVNTGLSEGLIQYLPPPMIPSCGVCGGGGAGGSGSPLQGGTSPTVVLVVVWGAAVVSPKLGTTTASPPHPAWCGDCTAQCAVHPTDGGAPAVLPLLPHPLAPPARHIASSLHPAGCRAGAGGGTSKDPTLPVDWVPIQPAGSLGSISV